MESDAELVELTTARSSFEAEMLVGALKGFGVDAVTFGDQLSDEFAVSQRVMGLSGGVRVMVRREQFERAQEALAEIVENRPTPDEVQEASGFEEEDDEADEEEDDDDDGSGPGGRTILAFVLLGAAVVVLGWLYAVEHQKVLEFERSDPVFVVEWARDSWIYRWADNELLASTLTDADGDGTYETSKLYDRDGQLRWKLHDRNENGVFERYVLTGPDGRELGEHVDADENRVVELVVYPAVDGVQERWLDADEDGRFERQEFVDAEHGDVFDAFEDRGREGYVRVK